MTKRVVAAVGAAALLVRAACDGAVTVVRSRGGTTYAEDAQTVAALGVNAVVVRNSPVPPQAVLEALQARYSGNQYRFVLAPDGGGWTGYTVIIGFGQPPVGARNQCADRDIALPPAPAGTTVITGDYCFNDRVIAEAVGRSPAISGAGDPHLRALVGDVVAELFAQPHRSGP